MKKAAGIAIAGALALSMMPVSAAEEATETTDASTEQSGEIWASVSSSALDQLKVTLPIKIEFAMTPDDAGTGKKVTVGDYKIRVDKDSDVGVNLDKVYVKSVDGTDWKLDKKTAVEGMNSGADGKDLKTVAISLAGKELQYANNEISGFSVEVAGEKTLGIEVTPTKGAIPADTEAKAEKAFEIVYTISQKAKTAPGS